MAKKINWLIPQEMGEEEFIADIKKAEEGPFFSVEESKLRFEQWQKNRLSKRMFPTIIPVLQEVRRDFKHEEDSNFVIDLCINKACEFQVIDLQTAQQIGLLDYNRGEFGFVAYLVFDVNAPEEVAKHERFKSMPIAARFGHSTYQNIPCYGLNLGNDVDEVAKMLAFLLIHVYGISPDQTVEASIQY